MKNLTSLTIEQLQTHADKVAFNFKSYNGYASYIPEDELPDGPENWTTVNIPDLDCPYISRVDKANGVVITKHLHKWMTGEFSDFFTAPLDDAIVYMDTPEKALGVLIRIKKDGDFTEPFRWLASVQDYIETSYPLLSEAEEIHSSLEQSELLSAIFNYCYEYLKDTPEAREQAQWVAELAKLLFNEYSICDSDGFYAYAYDVDEESDFDATILDFLARKGLMMQEEES
jgi:hypothetical protein